MRDNTAYKNEALAALKGNWAPSVLAIIVYVVAVMLVIAPFEVKFFLTDPTDLSAAKTMSVLLGFYVIGIFLIAGPLLVGLVNAFKVLLLSGDNKLVSNELKIGFGNWWHHVWGYLLKSVLVFLWSLLFIIPGIIKSLANSH